MLRSRYGSRGGAASEAPGVTNRAQAPYTQKGSPA